MPPRLAGSRTVEYPASAVQGFHLDTQRKFEEIEDDRDGYEIAADQKIRFYKALRDEKNNGENKRYKPQENSVRPKQLSGGVDVILQVAGESGRDFQPCG